ncbi:MAG TPA: crotonase/enoyl-CoA hydratase family protein [Alphaproteobacteria bacterium]|jgi:enoyl-CoA hydratase/carnithine racemase|nr:crotonase/enoyl-CoA hydratase family protein [Alphaproteobacteria bacterium]
MSEDPNNPDGRIVTEVQDHIMLIGIDRPHKLNGFTPKMLRELGDAYTAMETDDEVWCGVLHGIGPHMTAGLDLPKVAPHMAKGERLYGDDNVDPMDLMGRRRTKPMLAAVKGITYTIGIELMLACDIVIAADDCRFSQLEVKRNIMAAGGATIRMVQRAGWGNAMNVLLTGREFDAMNALRLGFVQEVVETGRELIRAIDVAREICAQGPLAVRATIANARKSLEEGFAAAVGDFRETNMALLATEDAKEGVQSFIDKRPAQYKGR